MTPYVPQPNYDWLYSNLGPLLTEEVRDRVGEDSGVDLEGGRSYTQLMEICYTCHQVGHWHKDCPPPCPKTSAEYQAPNAKQPRRAASTLRWRDRLKEARTEEAREHQVIQGWQTPT